MMRVKDIIDDPKKKLGVIILKLKILQTRLYGCRNLASDEPLVAIVSFFGEVSPWYDSRELEILIADFQDVNYGKYNGVIEKLKELNIYFIKAGRYPTGMNRSQWGQTVTPQDVFLGKASGLSMRSVPFWKNKKNDPKGGWGYGYEAMNHLNSYDVISKEAKDFVEKHTGPMCDLICELENYIDQN